MTNTPEQRLSKLDLELREIQRKQALKAFQTYERKLAAAYKRSQNPFPPKHAKAADFDVYGFAPHSK